MAGIYGNQSHCNTSKYHQACIYYSQELPWPQAQARAAKDWAKWGSDASVSRTPARRPPELREWSRSAPRRRTGRRGSEEGAPKTTKSIQGLSSVQGSQGAQQKPCQCPPGPKTCQCPPERPARRLRRKLRPRKSPCCHPRKSRHSIYSSLEDEEEELGEGSISDREVDPDSLKTRTTKSKPAASKADAKSKATKVAPAASSSWKPGGADRGSSAWQSSTERIQRCAKDTWFNIPHLFGQNALSF